jgi:deoxyhypusine monooxygenase
MGDAHAVPILKSVLIDASREPIVRHEAAEALAAIADPQVLPLLREYMSDPVQEVANTCEIAVRKLEWQQSMESKEESPKLSANPYASVDPAPPSLETDTKILRENLLDESLSLFDRYRAMFALRNKGDKESVLAIAEGNVFYVNKCVVQ